MWAIVGVRKSIRESLTGSRKVSAFSARPSFRNNEAVHDLIHMHTDNAVLNIVNAVSSPLYKLQQYAIRLQKFCRL